MKKLISMLLILACLAGMAGTVSAEKGFETLYELYCTEEVFGQPQAEYEYGGGDDVKVCFAIFLFDAEYDMTTAILIGRNAENDSKYFQWVTDYEPGATIMTFLLSKFADLKAVCEADVDFCISYSFDGGETMTEFDTAEAAEEFMAALSSTEETK